MKNIFVATMIMGVMVFGFTVGVSTVQAQSGYSAAGLSAQQVYEKAAQGWIPSSTSVSGAASTASQEPAISTQQRYDSTSRGYTSPCRGC